MIQTKKKERRGKREASPEKRAGKDGIERKKHSMKDQKFPQTVLTAEYKNITDTLLLEDMQREEEPCWVRGKKHRLMTFTFAFDHLADAFIQSDVQMRRTIEAIKTIERATVYKCLDKSQLVEHSTLSQECIFIFLYI